MNEDPMLKNLSEPPPVKVEKKEEVKSSFTPNIARISGQSVIKKDQQVMVKRATEDQMAIAQKLIELETTVMAAKNMGCEWVEVDKDILNHLLGGKETKSGYIIYKDVRLCLPDTAEEIAAREGMDVHDLVFKKGE